MSELRLFDPQRPEPQPFLRGTSVPRPASPGGGEHRISTPVLPPEQGGSTGEGAPAAPPPDILSLSRRVAAKHDGDVWQPLPKPERERVRRECTLLEFYERYLAAGRVAQVQAKELSRGALDRERQSLRRWSDWDRSQLDDPAWKGMAIGEITDGYVESWLAALRARPLAAATVLSTWSHLKFVLISAVKLRVRTKAPVPRPSTIKRLRNESRKRARRWSEAEMESIFHHLSPHPDLQTAFVLANNVGGRAEDVFAIRWGDCRIDAEIPEVTVYARKTRKTQNVPLAPLTVAFLRRHRERLRQADLFGELPEDLVFPGRGNPTAKQPGKTKVARRRTRLLKEAIAAAGISPVPEKPWQVCRKTCNIRLKDHAPGVGEFVLGHDAKGVNAESYDDPTDRVVKAVNSVPQPAGWQQALDRRESDLPGQRVLFG